MGIKMNREKERKKKKQINELLQAFFVELLRSKILVNSSLTRWIFWLSPYILWKIVG